MEIAVNISQWFKQRKFFSRLQINDKAAEAMLVNAAREGDRVAFGKLYDRYAPMVHGIILARVPATEVDDLVQDVFLFALGHLPSLREVNAFGKWLATIARNRAFNYHRHKQETMVMVEAVPTDGQTEAQAILKIIHTLPEAYRETLVLRLVEEMTGPEIAARTGLTPASVRVNLHRGMKLLREKLTGGKKHE